MRKGVFNMTLFEELNWRGLIKDMTSPEIEKKLNDEKITFYIGTDPTGDSLFGGTPGRQLFSGGTGTDPWTE